MRLVNVNEVIDKSKFNKFFLITFLICLSTMIFDGYEMNVFGVIVPLLLKDADLHPTPTQVGILASYALYGMIVGSMLFGVIADKIGRKKAIILSVIVYSVFTGLCGFSKSQTEFAIFRFIAGFGIGGVVPNLVTMLTEYSPRANRALLATLVSVGVPVGTVLASGTGIFLLADYGWRLMFFIAFIPLLMVPIIYYFLPETMVIYVKKGEKDKIRRTLMQANPEYIPGEDDDYIINRNSGKVSFFSLFRSGFARNTVLFCIAYFMNLFMIFGIQVWLPKLMMLQGYPLGSSLWFLLTFNMGAFLGMSFGGWAAAKYGYQKILVTFYIIAAILISILSIKTNIFALSMVLFMIGAAILGVQGVINSYSSQCYPLTFRSTALGSVNSFGRLGGAIGPTIGGILIAVKVSMTVNFIIFAIPAVIAAIVIILSIDYTKYSFPDEGISSNAVES